MIPQTYQRGGMTMVPETFAPSVNEGETPMVPAGSPFVRPMQNGAPGELAQTAGTLAQAGTLATHLGNTIGDRVQETMDDANVRNADTQFLTTASDIATKYTHSLGMDAINGLAPAQQAIVKAKNDAAATLTNPIQQQMFAQMATQRLVEFGKQLSDHQYQQHIQYGTQAANDRADALVQQAANGYDDWQRPDGNFAKNKMMAVHEAQEAALLLGQPVDSPQSQALVKQKTTALAQGVLTRMMDKEQYSEAQQYLDANKNDIDERQYEVLSNAVLEGHQSHKGALLAQQAPQVAMGGDGAQQRITPVAGGSITSTMGAPRPDGRTHDGIDIAVPVGTGVRAPANGTVTKVWNDDKFGGGLSMEITYPNGNVEGFAHLSAVNYKPGQQVTQGMTVALTGKSGDATGPVLHWAMKDANGQWVDPRSVGAAPQNPNNFTTPEQFEKALAYINGSDATQRVKDIAIARLHSQYSMARSLQEQTHTDALKQATDYWFQNGQSLDGLPAQVKMQLTPTDLGSFVRKGEEAYTLDQDVRKEKGVSVLANWDTNPKDMTVDAVRQAYAQGQISDSQYQTALPRAVKLQSDPVKVKNATMDHDQLTDILAQNQLPNLAAPKSTQDKLQRVELETAIRNEIDVQQQRNNRELTWQEKGKIARDMVIDKVYTPGFFTAGKPEPVALLTPDQYKNATVWVGGQKVRMMDIPAQYAMQATEDLKANRLPTTQANIAAWWLKKGKPTR